jgi:N-acetylmuramoyl-L-alanine amidase
MKDDIDILARTLYGEARGEYFRPDGGISSLIAIGNVIINRLRNPKRYGIGIQGVCQKAYQFSCWNRQDPNRVIIEAVSLGDDKVFDLCHSVATKLGEGEWPDLTQGSNHYHAASMRTYPAWAEGVKPQTRIGQHIFYRL